MKNSNLILQQDNASAHEGELGQKFLREQHVEVRDWLSQSLDLNIIENVWAFIKSKLTRLLYLKVEYI